MAALYPVTTHEATPELASLDEQPTAPGAGTFSVVNFAPAEMPVNAGAVGGTVSRWIVSGWFVVPPALVALHVNVTAPSPDTDCGSQPDWMPMGDSASATVQV